MTLQQAISNAQNISRLDEKTVRSTISKLKKEVNRRASAIQRSSQYSHALNRLEERNGLERLTKSRTLNNLRSQAADLGRFFNSESSTITGIRRINQEIERRGIVNYSNWSVERQSQYWRLTERIEEFIKNLSSDTIQTEISVLFNQGASEQEIIERLNELSQQEYQMMSDEEFR